ncbi:sulfonate ABC transporter substrate-binding protein [Falsiroseomonas sp. HW251]|uniref:sulfonate ABC transporter substrate-binding protein n=1 Tax=Falsiroseomonas sp. HW251 TaxID=3390998 RepID=UPI003D314708
MSFRRRALIGASLAPLVAPAVLAQERQLRIGYQKYGNLVLLKARGSLEPRLRAQGFRIAWAEFNAGPPILEAINAGAVEFGSTGEAPPIFAQAAGAPIAYVAHEPASPRGEAILVQRDSAIQRVAELRGRKVAFNRGSNVHYLVVRALEAAGLRYADIEPQFLAPADARVAFERRTVDAWAIWDPFLAAAEAAGTTRQLADGTGIVANHQFYLAHDRLAAQHPEVVRTIVEAIDEVNRWVQADIPRAARELAPETGIPAPVLEVALLRQGFGIAPLSESVVAEQQRIADVFHGLGLLPRAIRVGEAVRGVAG